EFRRGDEDLYPRLREVMTQRHLDGPAGSGLVADHGDHIGADRGESVYEGGNERVRTAIMVAFGYFHTQSSHHASEYLPYFRKTPQMVREFIPQDRKSVVEGKGGDGGGRRTIDSKRQ